MQFKVMRNDRDGRAQRGMTLIEIMIVIAIIGMIAALVISRYTHAESVGQVGATKLQIMQIAAAVDAYHQATGTYPAGLVVAGPSAFGGAGNQYMNTTPTDAGTTLDIWTGWGGTPYTIMGRQYDGSLLQDLHTWNGGSLTGTPVAGTLYNIFYSPNNGIFTYP